jgi:hypothetical protein
MAFCTRCKSEIDALAAFCPKCGWDFAEDPQHGVQRGIGSTFAYSSLADVALVIGQVAAGSGCVVALVGSILALASGNWFIALLPGPIVFFVLLAVLVVFLRVQDFRTALEPPRRLPRLTDRFETPDESPPERKPDQGIQARPQ